MSVINDMLRDLDQRQAPERAPDYVNASSSDVRNSMIEPQKKNNISKLILLLMLVLALAWSAKFMFFPNENPVLVSSVFTPDIMKPDAKEANAQSTQKLTVSDIPLVSDNEAVKPKSTTPSASNATIVKKQSNQTSRASKVKSAEMSLPKSEPNNIHTKTVATKLVSSKVKQKQTKLSVEPLSVQKLLSQKKPKLQQARAQNVKVQAPLSPKAADNMMAKQAIEMFQKGESRQAFRALFTFLAAHEVDVKSRIVLVSNLLSDKRLAEAGDVLLNVNSTTDRDPMIRQLKARWQVENGEHQLAIITLKTNLPEIASYPGYYELLASYYQRFGYPQLALKTYADLVQFDENVADWWTGLAIAADQSKQWLQAEFAYKQAVKLPDLNPQLMSFVKSRIVILDEIKKN